MKQKAHCDSEVMLVCPSIPVGGRLSNFVKKWESVTDDEWVLTTIREGLQLDFNVIPKKHRNKAYTCKCPEPKHFYRGNFKN